MKAIEMFGKKQYWLGSLRYYQQDRQYRFTSLSMRTVAWKLYCLPGQTAKY